MGLAINSVANSLVTMSLTALRRGSTAAYSWMARRRVRERGVVEPLQWKTTVCINNYALGRSNPLSWMLTTMVLTG